LIIDFWFQIIISSKLKILKFAAIDIGSNALRLLFSNVVDVDGEPVFKKAELYRFPLRLGEDVFLHGRISEHKINQLCQVLTGFKLLITAWEAQAYRVCATSAIREAANQKEAIEKVYDVSGLNIEVIDGATEAGLIFSNHIEERLDKSGSYLYIDVGGGSTELTLFSKGKVAYSASFNIGTIRLLHDQVSADEWKSFKQQLERLSVFAGKSSITAIGSGGNINKIFKLAGRRGNQLLSFDKLKECYEMVSSYSFEERISHLKLNTDRADVIIPAFRIFISVMREAGIDKIMVPQVGLSDGIVRELYKSYCLQLSQS
jgi:exopolyphosphatase/guanosine-5'-triphosphate,3'-diphosphate pyrophosphatase